MDAGVAPTDAWQLLLATADGRSKELLWTGMQAGNPVIYDSDPETSAWQRFTAWVIAQLPIEKEL
jgi:hypothetical protein